MVQTLSSSKHQILRATSIVAIASVLNIVIGLGRTKVAALLLGPKGIAEIGIFFNLIQLAATVGALGLGTSAVRQIADARGRHDDVGVAAAQRALIWTSLMLAVVSGVLFWCFSDIIMRYMAVDVRLAPSFGWLAVAVSLSILSAVPIALLISHRRIRDQAVVQIVGALIGTVIGIAFLVLWRENGVIGYTLSSSAAMLVAGLFVSRRLPRMEQMWNFARTLTESRAMTSLGLPLMIGAISVTGGMLALRSLLAHRLGPVALGQFTAAWTLCVTYVAFVLQAMAADYFPRLSGAINDRVAACRAVSEQIETTLLIALPIILGVQASAPWLIRILYSSDFSGALEIVRWQILGDVFKIAAAPFAYVILAKGRGRLYWFVEAFSIVALVGLAAVLLPSLGLKATGIGYLLATIFYLPLVQIMAYRLIGFIPDAKLLRLLVTSLTLTALVGLVSAWWPMGGLILGAVLATAAGAYAIRALDLFAALPLPLQRYASVLMLDRTGNPIL